MSDKENKGSIVDEFLALVRDGEENKHRLAATKSGELIGQLADIYLENGQVAAYVKIPELTYSHELPKKHYQDLVDIYCMESRQFPSAMRDAKIDLIELIGAEFEGDAIDYIASLAFTDCPEQEHALKLILVYSQLASKKASLSKILKQNFSKLGEDLQNMAINFLTDVGFDSRFIASLKDDGEKQWWKFW